MFANRNIQAPLAAWASTIRNLVHDREDPPESRLSQPARPFLRSQSSLAGRKIIYLEDNINNRRVMAITVGMFDTETAIRQADDSPSE
jgi:hypothetical protein